MCDDLERRRRQAEVMRLEADARIRMAEAKLKEAEASAKIVAADDARLAHDLAVFDGYAALARRNLRHPLRR